MTLVNKSDDDRTLSSVAYQDFLSRLTDRVRTAQIRAAQAVNRELISLYWDTGQEILLRQAEYGWGAKLIDRLSADLRRAFPDIKGFSVRNLKYMRAFAEAWPDQDFVQQAAARIPWFHNCVILDKTKIPEERTFDPHPRLRQARRQQPGRGQPLRLTRRIDDPRRVPRSDALELERCFRSKPRTFTRSCQKVPFSRPF